ncbi:hypothetical protein UG55_106534 [Frankia sp. EI5c]|nr:hypothetical protein UG55_106534 [Frankia sp. EI5c]
MPPEPAQDSSFDDATPPYGTSHSPHGVPPGDEAAAQPAPPPGGWTPPVEDPLFGPMPTYATGAYPLVGQQQGGYPTAGYPAGWRQPGAAWPAPESAAGGVDSAGPSTGAPVGTVTGGGPAGGPQTGRTADELAPATGTSHEGGKGFSFHRRAATGPVPTPASPPEPGLADRQPSRTEAPYPAAGPADSGPAGPVDEGPRTGPMAVPRPTRARVALSRQVSHDHQSDNHQSTGERFPGRPPAGADHPATPAQSAEPRGRFQLPDEEPTSTRRRPRGLLAVAVGAVLVILAAAAVVMVLRGDSGSSAAEEPRQVAPSVDPNFINSARADAAPVRADEFFPDRQVTVQGRTYTRLATSLVSGCPDLTGELATTFKDDVCTQLVRALYLTTPAGGGPQVLAGMSVFVVDTQSTAQAGATIAAGGRGGVNALPIPEGSITDARVLGPAGDNSWRAAIARGHYMLLTQLAYVDGTQGTAEDAPLRNAITDLGLIAAEPIAQRMVSGGTGTAATGTTG